MGIIKNKTLLIFLLILPLSNCLRDNVKRIDMLTDNPNLKVTTFGSGCFWCTEAIFERVNGVVDVISGYSGGTVENPSYKQVSSGATGHAECTQIKYDPAIISYYELLEIFWKTHDPTTPNRQGNDVGTQYRSIIFYHDEEQKQKAEFYKNKLNDEKIFTKPIITEIVEFKKFYPAEEYHQDYFEKNPNQAYCAIVILPKVEKFLKIFNDKLKKY
jgi:peptide-methionine (S)-S-oxide reductase